MQNGLAVGPWGTVYIRKVVLGNYAWFRELYTVIRQRPVTRAIQTLAKAAKRDYFRI
jgi:hypothetical protein